MSEMNRAFETYIEACDNQNSVLVIKRIHKNMKDNHQQRQLKIAKEIKIEKVFKYLQQKNEDAEEQILRYRLHYYKRQSTMPPSVRHSFASPVMSGGSKSALFKLGDHRSHGNRNSFSIKTLDSLDIKMGTFNLTA